jgi:hypothetical protein
MSDARRLKSVELYSRSVFLRAILGPNYSRRIRVLHPPQDIGIELWVYPTGRHAAEKFTSRR